MNKKITLGKVIIYLIFWPYILLWMIIKYLIKNRPAYTPVTNKAQHSVSTLPSPTTNALVTSSKDDLTESLRVPEPTRSLLFITDEDTSKIQSATGASITISINVSTGASEVTEDEKGFYAEPSLIWTKLPVKANTWLEKNAMYWPSYSQFSPEHRYQYLRWLKNIEQPTNLSYVFLYFYGLERHLLIGEYDKAVDEILRLLKAHTQKSFRSYATSALITASLVHKRLDIIDRAPFLLEEEVDEALALRIIKGTSMSPEDMVSIASRVGFTNKRYIKLQPERFNHHLQNVIDEFESEHGKVMSIFKLDSFKKERTSVFANMSIPEESRTAEIPIILDDKKFQAAIHNALQEAHSRTKNELAAQRSTK